MGRASPNAVFEITSAGKCVGMSVRQARATGVAGPTDAELARWLAQHTDTDVRDVEAGLEDGRRRRDFVVSELLDAGYEGDELVVLTVHLTGLPLDDARALIARHLP